MLQAVKNFFHHEIKDSHDASAALLAMKMKEFEAPRHTPDIVELESKLHNYVFVPDECKMTHNHHQLVACGTSGFYPYCPAYTSLEYNFVEKKLGKESIAIPFVDIGTDNLPPWMLKKFRIKGELYALRGCSFIPLDNHKLNGVAFERIKVRINVPHFKRYRQESQSYNGVWHYDYTRSKDMLTSMEVFMYVGKTDFWLPQLEAYEALYNFDSVPVATAPDERIWIREYFEYKQGNR